MRTRVIYARSADMRRAIERAAELTSDPSFRPLKNEGRTLAGTVEIEGSGVVFIKRSTERSWMRAVAARLSKSRCARVLRGAAYLEAVGVGHPRVLAAAECLRAGAVRESYIITEALAGADTLSKFALGSGGTKGRDTRRRRKILAAVARETKRMHDAGIYTRDLQETNVMVSEDGMGGFRVHFIDLEDFRRARSLREAQRLRNLVHLDRSIGRFLCRAARLAFLYDYLGGRPSRDEAHRIIAAIREMRDRVERRGKAQSIPPPINLVPHAAGSGDSARI